VETTKQTGRKRWPCWLDDQLLAFAVSCLDLAWEGADWQIIRNMQDLHSHTFCFLSMCHMVWRSRTWIQLEHF